MMSILALLSILGTFCSVVGSIGPILAVQDKIYTKQIDQVPQTFLILSHIIQLLWLLYGFKAELPGIILVNFITTILTLACVLMIAREKKSLKSFCPAYLVFFFVTIVTCTGFIKIKILGRLCTIFGLLSQGAAMESIIMVFKTGNYLFIDLKIVANILMNSIVWGLYGYLSNDPNVFLVNFSGAITGLVLLGIYFYYGCSKVCNNFPKLKKPQYAFIL